MNAPSPARRPVTVVVPLPPTYRGGTEEYAYRLVQRFSESGPVRVLTTRVRYTPETGAIGTGSAEVEMLPARELLQRPLVLPGAARRRFRAAAARGEVVQLHMPFPFVESAVVAAARKAGVPTVLTYHMDADLGGASGVPGSGVVTRAYRRLSAVPALEASDAVVSNSRGYAEASPVLSRFLAKTRVIPKGVDLARLGIRDRSRPEPRPACVRPEWVSGGGESILFVGRLVLYKGVPLLLEAARGLFADRPRLHLLIAGRGPLEGRLRERARALGIAERVHFLGFVPDAELGALYQASRVVCGPSIGRLESTATALEEAAALGTPVVGSDLPGTSETVPHDGRRGILVPPGEAEALARAIDRLLDEERPPPPAHVRTWDDTARDYLELFRELGARWPPAERARPMAIPSAG